ncbi:glutathione S-transferase [Pseudaestuariivita rosea]|uniref:glutathione S-transferase n=1 Tax=Pseudaestuariivita rosea TaxID=2763263 RepID=UPI001ABAECC6|nr:glutathione S-transferase [Pseudaestuariivita rosea]
MTYDIALGDRSYSSWSLRGWLLFKKFGLTCTPHFATLYTDEFPKLLEGFAPAKTVPAVRFPDGTVVADSLAIAEELASRHPDAGHWPSDPVARATARALAAEMHSGFSALRSECPMNLRKCYVDFPVSDAVHADLDRLDQIWAHSRQITGSAGPWLCGRYSVADAFFAPVAARITGYGLPVSRAAQDYVDAQMTDPAFARWRQAALVEGPDQAAYAMEYSTKPWPY